MAATSKAAFNLRPLNYTFHYAFSIQEFQKLKSFYFGGMPVTFVHKIPVSKDNDLTLDLKLQCEQYEVANEPGFKLHPSSLTIDTTNIVKKSFFNFFARASSLDLQNIWVKNLVLNIGSYSTEQPTHPVRLVSEKFTDLEVYFPKDLDLRGEGSAETKPESFLKDGVLTVQLSGSLQAWRIQKSDD